MRAPRSLRRASKGFTLVELGVVLAVMAVIMAIAIPNFQVLTTNGRLAGSANEIVALMQVARIEAVRRNVVVDVCPSTDGAACGGSNWARVIVLAAGQGTLREYAAPSQLVVRVSSNFNTGNRIRFRPDGFAWKGDATAVSRLAGRLQVCEDVTTPGNNARDVVFSGARVSVDAVSSAGCATALSD